LGQDLDEVLIVGSHKTPNTVLSKGMQLSRRDLVNLALIYSDNVAAITLSENYANGHAMFMYKMNDFARELDMTHSGFVEPTGLSPMNYSNVADIIKLTKAVSEFDIVKQAAQSNQVSFVQPVKVKKKTVLKRVTKNPTINYFGKEGIVTIKTGFTKAAGFCITLLIHSNNQLYNVTVLGAKTKNERRLLVEKMLKDIYNA
jgi:D-alanyl-D-alanine endopeptidase (penicillin-binding protein 7)